MKATRITTTCLVLLLSWLSLSGFALAPTTPRGLGSITYFPIPTRHSHPQYIAADPHGNLWFTESDYHYLQEKIGRITPDGAITEFQVPSLHSEPVGITAGSDGNLWFTENFGGNIGRITPDGTITEFPTQGGSPFGITTGSDGNLWFTTFYGNSIGRFSLS